MRYSNGPPIMPRVSIIMPAWNAERFIGETIRSVQTQTIADWELIVADDGSFDGTVALVERFAAEDPRIRLVSTNGHCGPAVARQMAIDHAKGRYLAFLDSDDLWLPQKLERQLRFMAEKEAALSYTSFRRMREDGKLNGKPQAIPLSLTYDQLLKNTAIATLTVMIDRKIAGPVAMTNRGYDDLCLWLAILKRGNTAWGLNEDLARYRVCSGSISSRPWRSARWVWIIYREVENLSLPRAVWCLAHYGVRAWLKRLPPIVPRLPNLQRRGRGRPAWTR